MNILQSKYKQHLKILVRSEIKTFNYTARYFVSHTLPLTLCLFHFYRLLLYIFNTSYLRQEVIREKVKLKHRKKLQKLNK